MAFGDPNAFFNKWQKYIILSLAIIEVIIIIIFILTELGNVASNLWLTNVFAGTWCGFVAAIHVGALFTLVFYLTGAEFAFIALIITIVALLGYALLISFNAVFIAQPSTCILTSSCTSQSTSTTVFSYSWSQNFFTTFNSLNGFKTYTLTQAKYLFQTVQISFGCLGFVLCVVYIVIYFMRRKELANRVIPLNQRKRDSHALSSVVMRTGDNSRAQRQQPPTKAPYVPPPPPGEIPWNPRKH